MKFTLTVVALLSILALAQADRIPALARSWEELIKEPRSSNYVFKGRSTGVQTKWMTQKLDHFDKQNKRIWQMRYMVNDEYFKDGGPIFIYLGGEWEIERESIQTGIIVDLAKTHNGILFYTEHRYYGQSKPTWDLSIDNIKYLHAKQALADLAHFIITQRNTDPRLAKSKVILSGCSYSAAMAVWFNRLYPDLVDGTWASSAPLLAQVDFKEYSEVVGKAIYELGSPQCYNRIKNGIVQLQAMLAGNRAAEAKQMLYLCNNFNHNNDLDISSLFCTLANLFKNAVQIQAGGVVQDLCKTLMSSTDDLTAITNHFVDKLSDKKTCIEATFNGTVNYFRNTHLVNLRSWHYQTCNEFGWFQTSASSAQPFGNLFPVSLFTSLCHDIFDTKYTTEHIYHLVAETNMLFGGIYPNVKNVYMTHGSLDPWSPMGQRVSQGSSIIASVIHQASHCADLGSISYYDNPTMRASKERLFRLVSTWLA